MKNKYIKPANTTISFACGSLIMAGSTGNGRSQDNGQGGDPSEAKRNLFFDEYEDEGENSLKDYHPWK